MLSLNVFFLVLIALDSYKAGSHEIRSLASEFSQHSVVRPNVHHGKTKREITSSNEPKQLFESSTCGNGFVEPGEQCDCGLVEDAVCAACCQPLTCMFRSNATCAAGDCCDMTMCRPREAGTVCRAADRECDLPEYCSGHSEYCPRDVHKMDATPCAGGKAFCAGGLCRTHTDQCHLLWGSSGEIADLNCYTDLNIRGSSQGNCGYLGKRASFFRKCSTEDVLCGLLQCQHQNQSLMIGMESASVTSTVIFSKDVSCHSAILDLGTRDPNLGFVPDGAKCGPDKMCLDRRCVSVAAVRMQLTAQESDACRENCLGHGVCNSEGHCHCDAGYLPPLCTPSCDGGSLDSGPAPPCFRQL